MFGKHYVVQPCQAHYNVACVQPEHIRVWEDYSRLEYNPKYLYLIVVDALAVSKNWPTYVLYEGKLYKRGHQMANPHEVPAHSCFGMREYIPQIDFDEREFKTYGLMVLRDPKPVDTKAKPKRRMYE